jgi:predicted DNA-binding transcriptional regulator YafY
MKRTERLFALAEVLRGRRTGVTAEELASRFRVTVRTIYRDLDALRDASLPVTAERGRGGGYALDKSYSLPPVNFTAREAALLLALGRFALDTRFLPFVGTLEQALDKVRAALSGSAQRELLSRLAELRFVGIPALPVRAGVQQAVERAWFEQQTLCVVYRDANGVRTTREVAIENVVFERTQTLLNTLDLAKNDKRQFRMDRIEHASVPGTAQTKDAKREIDP